MEFYWYILTAYRDYIRQINFGTIYKYISI